jgi:hypothetical protein
MAHDGKLDLDFRNVTLTALDLNPANKVPSKLAFVKHAPVQGSLFAKTPHMDDISQQQIGDCWFLGTLVAILKLEIGPDIIENMMIETTDQNERVVIVRLYDSSLNRHYLRMQKSIVTSRLGNSEYHARVDPNTIGYWPAFLEKALTAFDRNGNLDVAGANYERIDGSTPQRAFQHLLGVPVTELPIVNPTAEFDGTLTTPKGPAAETFVYLLMGTPLSNAQLQAVFPGATPAADYNNWKAGAVATNLFGDIANAVAATAGVKVAHKGSQVSAGKVFRYEDFEKVVNTKATGVNAQVRQKVLNWVKAQQLLSGKRGTDLYSAGEIALYHRIQGAIAGGNAVVASTRSYLGATRTKDVGHSAGESVVKGLAGPHSYAVLGTNEDAAHHKFVTLANPWGLIGRSYNFIPGSIAMATPRGRQQADAGNKAFETSHRSFDLDLHDLSKRFSRVTFTNEPPLIEIG